MAGNSTFIARRSRGRLIILLAALVALSVTALLVQLPIEGSRFMARLEMALRVAGALGMLVTLYKLPSVFSAPVELEVSHRGIWYRPWSKQTVGWDQINKVAERKINIQRIVSVYLKDPDAFPINRRQRMANKLNQASGDFGDMNIMIQMTDRSIEELTAAIAAYKPMERK